MNEEKPPVEVQECPVHMPVSYFGANYQDSQCIDGYLWDEDSGEGDGLLYNGGDIPCPFCRPVEHTQYQLNNDDDVVVCGKCETTLTQLHWAETKKPSVKLYGFCKKCNCNQWATIKEEREQGHD